MNSTPPNGFLTADPPVHSSLLPSPRNLKSLCLEGPPPALLPKSQQGLKERLTTPSSGKPSTTAQQLPFYTMSFKPTNSQASCPGTLSDLSLHLLPLTQLADWLCHTCNGAQVVTSQTTGGKWVALWRDVTRIEMTALHSWCLHASQATNTHFHRSYYYSSGGW